MSAAAQPPGLHGSTRRGQRQVALTTGAAGEASVTCNFNLDRCIVDRGSRNKDPHRYGTDGTNDQRDLTRPPSLPREFGTPIRGAPPGYCREHMISATRKVAFRSRMRRETKGPVQPCRPCRLGLFGRPIRYLTPSLGSSSSVALLPVRLETEPVLRPQRLRRMYGTYVHP